MVKVVYQIVHDLVIENVRKFINVILILCLLSATYNYSVVFPRTYKPLSIVKLVKIFGLTVIVVIGFNTLDNNDVARVVVLWKLFG